MKRPTIPLMAALLVACGPKPAPAPAPEPEPEATPRPEPMPEAVTRPEPEPEPNADFQATLGYANGTTFSGRVIRVERGQDWFAEKGWVDSPPIKLTVGLEKGSDARDAAWDEIRSLTIDYARGDDSVDCQFDSSFQPMMYMCALRTDSDAKLTDGTVWTVSSRYKWRFTFADGTQKEFYVNKLPARAQDAPTGGLTEENPEMYVGLREQVLQESRTALTRVTISP